MVRTKLLVAMLVFGMLATVSGRSYAASKFEPQKGCYIGAVLDWADVATKGEGKTAVDRFANGMKAFNDEAKKPHALYEQFIFFPHGADWEDKQYYNKYPTWDSDPCKWSTAKEFTEACDKVGATPIFTIEPYVCKDFYENWAPGNAAYDNTLKFAKGCAAYKKPIFIRFAHEMNGSWYPWGSWLDKNLSQALDAGEETDVTPERYVTMFRNFVTLVRKTAPNVAIIWCPNQGWLGIDTIKDNYTPWYPGDDYVDWVALDFYERGWFLPAAGARLWGGQFKHGLLNDSKDDPATQANESVNFYKTYCVDKKKPLMICETGATQTYRSDLTPDQRKTFSHEWKAKFWDKVNQGWIHQVYGSSYNEKDSFMPMDTEFPMLKGIVWFQQGKKENLPGYRKKGNKGEVVWFKDEFTDYRIGFNGVSEETKYAQDSMAQDELDLYARMVSPAHFLSKVAEK